jgi:predicted O-linked N-acetylglucosamine transferase (SPINDLY family)
MKFRALFKSKRADKPAAVSTEPQVSAALHLPSHLQLPAATQALLRQANPLHGDGLMAEAASAYQAALAIDPQDWASSNAMASIALEAGEMDEAIRRYGALIEGRPDFAEGHYKRGNAYNRLGRLPDALADYDRAIALDPGYAKAFCNRGTVLGRLARWDEALASYERALTLNPKDAFAHYNRADVLRELKRSDEAIGSYDQAIVLNGAYVEAYVNRGHLLHRLSRNEQAAASYAQALELSPILTQAVGSSLPAALRPEQKYLIGLKRHVQMQICDWQGMSADLERISEGLRALLPVTQPLPVLAMLDDPALHRAAAESWIREESPPNPALGAIPSRPRSPRIRVGYFSADFRMHPVAYLTAGLFEHHDRSRFELTAFAFGPQSHDLMQARLSKAFDRFLDVRAQSDVEVAALARDLGIDIAVNLNGLTEHSRSKIFALRAAPIQINYLGYAGTMGAGFMDYLIADSTVVPRAQQGEYAEKIIYLPGSYMPFDSSYAIADRIFTREELGLPAEGFVFCCFNNSFKITPDVFDRWMRILTRTENSVLWLAQNNPTATDNLRKEASRRGVDERRLIFADRMDSLPEHLSRLRAADLFLDTFPYNAHASSLDALWAGLPVLTCAGRSFPSRVAASILRAIGAPGLIAGSLSEYEDMAADLAANAAHLAQIRRMLAQNRSAAPLFDTARYARDLELAYEIVYDRHRSGSVLGHVNEHLVI